MTFRESGVQRWLKMVHSNERDVIFLTATRQMPHFLIKMRDTDEVQDDQGSTKVIPSHFGSKNQFFAANFL